MAGQRLVTLCPVQKEAVIWCEKCMVRYSNWSIFERLEIFPQASFTGTRNFTGDRDSWEKSLRGLLEGLKNRASMISRSKKNFVVGETSGPSFQTLYGMVQCIPDISEEDCSYCLSQGIATCDMKMSGYVLSPSCLLAYAPWRFYDPVNTDDPSSVPVTPSVNPKNETRSVAQGDKNRGVPKALIFSAVSVSVAVLVIIFLVVFLRSRKKRKKKSAEQNLEGVLSDGQEIAVKRLSKNAQQGETEFKNEFLLVAKLQHRNLVKLLGYSTEGTERLLVYEFLPHTSLDKFIFDPIDGKEMEWKIRYKIIGGVARGLLYLHQDSRMRIIHRDLKASNILLDEAMTPKIADF
ncbi:unnamed protein product [Arabis nemorensis]|uniref:non-specific serine/threonine protein kinase n=1 Tax=Arabis nemorensis TaxID=586526 RepID=A0A565C7N1_9BRAS|nr:unnamed protein product [Arabis nemorensis]